MFTDYTYQEWEATPEDERVKLLEAVISAYRVGEDFKAALEAKKYFRAENPAVMEKTVLKARAYEVKTEDGRSKKRIDQEAITGTQIASGFFARFVIQENQYLLGNGVTLETDDLKKRLGPGFDKSLEALGEMALVQGVSWGYWNADHLEVIEAAKDNLSGFVALLDEQTSAPRLGVQFWQLTEKRPLYVRLFEEDGVTVYRKGEKRLEEAEAKRPYKLRIAADAAGAQIMGGENYGQLPVIPLYGNSEHRSELTTAIKGKIDAYDRILSDYGDNLERANDVYWVLNNFGGTTDEIADMIEQINRLKIISNISDGTGNGSTAEPHAFEVPYAARQTALDVLKKTLYQDAMALDMDELTGSSLTNVAIQAATINLNLKCDRYEWQVFAFVQAILRLIGVESEKISFTRQDVVNRSEVVADIQAMRGDIDQRTALALNPYILPDDIDGIIENTEAENVGGQPSMEALQQALNGEAGNNGAEG